MAELYSRALRNDASLKAYWRFEGNSNDSAGTNNGTDTSVTYSNANGVYGQGAGFATTSLVQITSAASITNIFDTGGTIAGWVNPTTGGTNNAGRVGDKTNTTSAGWYYAWDPASNPTLKLRFAHYFTTGSTEYVTTNGVTTAGVWAHVAVTYSSAAPANAPTFYVNGLSVAGTNALTGTGTRISDSGVNLGIGQRTGTSNVGFDGAIDDVALFNRTLSANEIMQLFEKRARFYSLRPHPFSPGIAR